MIDGLEIDLADLHPKVRESASAPEQDEGGSFYDQIGEHEKKLLTHEYQRHEGNISKMAAALRMDRSHLHTKLKQHGIHSTQR